METDLEAALKKGQIAGAALDVFDTEPKSKSPLFGRPEVVVTPHLGASTYEAQNRAGVTIAEQVALALDGDFVPFAVNIAAEEVLDTVLSARSVRSLDESFEDDGDRSRQSILPDLRQESPDGNVLDESVRAKIDELLCQLDERESYIIRLYFGLEGEEPLTLEQIGGLMRSEEHTSELQSLVNLVCRLLLQKKKTTHQKEKDMTKRHA